MKKVAIKGAGGSLSLSGIVLGCCDFGSRIPEADAFRQMDLYYEAGGRTLDTARIYAAWAPGGESASERTVGRWLTARRRWDEMTVVTKGGHPPLSHMHAPRLSPEDLQADLADSLAALGTQCVDVYMLHRDDESRPVEEIMDTLDRFVQAGKARALGASNWRLERIWEANAYAARAGRTPFAVSQIQWSLAVCTPQTFGDDTLVCMDGEALAGYARAGLPVMAYSAQAKGVFIKLLAGERVESDFARRLLTAENRRRLERLGRVSRCTGRSPAALCTAYVTARLPAGCAVVSASTEGQLLDTLSGADLHLSQKAIGFLEGGREDGGTDRAWGTRGR